LSDVIAVVARLAAAFEFRRGHDGVVWRREREIEEEWPVGLGGILYVTHRVASDFGHDVSEVPPGEHWARPVDPALLERRRQRGHADGAVILDEAIRRVVGHVGAEVVIESPGGRAARDGPGEVHVAKPVRAGGTQA